ncbi:MAG: uL15 family ribosomal protein [Patescibacteria group bacterium]
MELHEMKRQRGLTKKRRIGRGGKRGKTSGRGGKGQTARAGNKPRPQWRDIIKKIPKRRGYGKNRARTAVPRISVAPVSLEAVGKRFKNGDTVSPATLRARGLVRRTGGKLPPVKILGGGVLSAKLTFENVAVSASAKSAIEASGSTIR